MMTIVMMTTTMMMTMMMMILSDFYIFKSKLPHLEIPGEMESEM